jgi:EAL domain-containing protein (putative c-di-GMP-specific phosphodiesterase class I)
MASHLAAAAHVASTRDPYDQGIVKAISTLGRTLGLRIIAEGIENEAQFEFVRSLQCDQVQGYFFYRPLSWPDLLDNIEHAEKREETAVSQPRVIQLYGTN